MRCPEPETFETTFARTALSALERDPGREFLRYRGASWTVADVLQRAKAITKFLVDQGVEPTDAVAVILDNHPDHVAVMIALGLIGAVWVPLDRRFRATNIARVLEQVPVAVAVADEQYHSIVRDSGYNGKLVAVSSLAEHGGSVDDLDYTRNSTPGQTRALLFTSGTTGVPKGVEVTERMFMASARFCQMASDADNAAVFYLWEPLNHIGGAQIIPMALLCGARIAMTDKFSVSRFWTEVIETGANRLHYLGGVLERLLHQPPLATDRQHRIALGFGAGATPDVARLFLQRFGIPLREVYGMTEASSFTSINHDGPHGSIGRALDCFDVQVRDAQGVAVPIGQEGEITLSSPASELLTPGYYHNPAATKQAFQQGYFRTGDLARMDEQGYLYFTGRLKEVIRCKGENVSPWEVESILKRHAAIAEAAVVGVDSELGEQDIAAFVKLITLDADMRAGLIHEVWQLLHTHLASFQLPRYIVEVEQFPRTPSERIEKHKLDVSQEMLDQAWGRRN